MRPKYCYSKSYGLEAQKQEWKTSEGLINHVLVHFSFSTVLLHVRLQNLAPMNFKCRGSYREKATEHYAASTFLNLLVMTLLFTRTFTRWFIVTVGTCFFAPGINALCCWLFGGSYCENGFSVRRGRRTVVCAETAFFRITVLHGLALLVSYLSYKWLGRRIEETAWKYFSYHVTH